MTNNDKTGVSLDALPFTEAPCDDARAWAATQPSAEVAWNTCERPDWMLWALSRLPGHPFDTEIRWIACDIARSVLHLATPGDDRPRLAVEAAEACLINPTPQTAAAVQAAWAVWAAAAWEAAWEAARAAREAEAEVEVCEAIRRRVPWARIAMELADLESCPSDLQCDVWYLLGRLAALCPPQIRASMGLAVVGASAFFVPAPAGAPCVAFVRIQPLRLLDLSVASATSVPLTQLDLLQTIYPRGAPRARGPLGARGAPPAPGLRVFGRDLAAAAPGLRVLLAGARAGRWWGEAFVRELETSRCGESTWAEVLAGARPAREAAYLAWTAQRVLC